MLNDERRPARDAAANSTAAKSTTRVPRLRRPPRLLISVELEGDPEYHVDARDIAEHWRLLHWLARQQTRARLIEAIDDALERLPDRMAA